jgi:hypothetical protein
MRLDYIKLKIDVTSYLDFFGIIKLILAVFFRLYVVGNKSGLIHVSDISSRRQTSKIIERNLPCLLTHLAANSKAWGLIKPDTVS